MQDNSRSEFSRPLKGVITDRVGPLAADAASDDRYVFIDQPRFAPDVTDAETADRVLRDALAALYRKYPDRKLVPFLWHPRPERSPRTCQFLLRVGPIVGMPPELEELWEDSCRGDWRWPWDEAGPPVEQPGGRGS